MLINSFSDQLPYKSEYYSKVNMLCLLNVKL
uniref:Macaca fascicularis brain cDNA clone: QflA-18194, similar to human fer-1-like 4 (C. elegans) (FER1L4) on chromosome 20, RefSeq: NR_001442.1 n=1 Tax=Macaca fascicularis TaxID=9541 RepID=I7G5N5_MACFA|nr:unnamed protein product [Macaca fascicularis]